MSLEPEGAPQPRPERSPDPLEDARRSRLSSRSLALAALVLAPVLFLAPRLIPKWDPGPGAGPESARVESEAGTGTDPAAASDFRQDLGSLKTAETAAPRPAAAVPPAAFPEDIAPDQVDLDRGLDQALLGAKAAAPAAPAAARKLKSFEPGSSAEVKSWDRPDEGPATTTAFYSLPPGMPEPASAQAAKTPAAPAHCPPGKCAILVPYKPGIPLCPDGHWVNSIARTCCATKDFCQANAADGICAMVQGGRVKFPAAQAPAAPSSGARAPSRSQGRSSGRESFQGSGHDGSRP